MSDPTKGVRFPNESSAYRTARETLLAEELALRSHVWEVAEARRALPAGGEVAKDYLFEEGPSDLSKDAPVRKVKLSELFAPGKESLIVYSFMYGPDMKAACPMCTSFLDSLDGTAPHARQRTNLVVVAKSPIARIRAHARDRGWRNLRLLSSARNTYNVDYLGEKDGDQMPMLNVFTRKAGKIHHFYGTEMLFAKAETDACHIDMIWPLWNVLDLTPEGRGSDFYPQLRYGDEAPSRRNGAPNRRDGARKKNDTRTAKRAPPAAKGQK